MLTIVLSYLLRGIIPPSNCLFPSWDRFKPRLLARMSGLDKLLDLIFHRLTLSGMPVVVMIPTPTSPVGILKARSPSQWWDQINAQGLVQNVFPINT